MTLAYEMNLSTYQAEAFARGLFAIAHCDGLHEREAALVASFWADTGGSSSALAELGRRGAIGAGELAEGLGDKGAGVLFLKTALLLVWADGSVSDKEKAILDAFTEALGLKEEREQLEGEVKEYLLSHLAHVQNVQAVADVAKKLHINE